MNFILLFHTCVCVCVCVCVNVCMHLCKCAIDVYMLSLQEKLAYFRIKELRIFYLCWVFQSKGRSRYSVFLQSVFFLPLYCNCLCKDLQVFYSVKILFLSLTCWLNNNAWSIFFYCIFNHVCFLQYLFFFWAGSNGQSYRFALEQ